MTGQEEIETQARRMGFERVNADGDPECWHRFIGLPDNHYFGLLPNFVTDRVCLESND